MVGVVGVVGVVVMDSEYEYDDDASNSPSTPRG